MGFFFSVIESLGFGQHIVFIADYLCVTSEFRVELKSKPILKDFENASPRLDPLFHKP